MPSSSAPTATGQVTLIGPATFIGTITRERVRWDMSERSDGQTAESGEQ